MEQPKQRQASRLILVDREERVLLCRHQGAVGREFWAPPGGGLEAGETFEQAAGREIAEELGLKNTRLTFLWEGFTDFVYLDRRVHQHERFFLVAPGLPALSPDVQKIHEHEGILELRWWTLAELESTEEHVFPADLVPRLRQFALPLAAKAQ